jgi:5-methylcytosine-specific restriction endonuclease McrA
MQTVIVLNADYTFLSITSWKNAVCLLIEGKAETLKETTRIVRNQDRTVEITVPLVVRVVRFVKSIFKKEVPFSKKNIIIRDKQICLYCGDEIENLKDCTVDHVIPRAQGGKSTWTNCVCCCKPCNHKKADRTPKEAKMKLKYRPYRPTIGEYSQFFTKKHGIDKLLKEL